MAWIDGLALAIALCFWIGAGLWEQREHKPPRLVVIGLALLGVLAMVTGAIVRRNYG